MKHCTRCLCQRSIAILAATVLGGLQASAEPAAAERPGNGVSIVVAPNANAIARFAGQELQRHLGLILGSEPPVLAEDPAGGLRFLVGLRPPDDKMPFAQIEEARYDIDGDVVHLYGDDAVLVHFADLKDHVVKSSGIARNRMGTLYAVYFFLEEELGVRWIEPGDEGIACSPVERLELQPKRRSWKTHMPYERTIRSYVWSRTAGPHPAVPEVLSYDREESETMRDENELWQRRMRLGTGIHLPFTHAFSRWWDRYGEALPEYFALNGKGERGPMDPRSPDRVKVCPSNPAVVDQAVANWLARRDANPLFKQDALCVAVNDGGGKGADEYCHCEACRQLDVRRPGEPFGRHLTDRYMHLANRTLAAARKHDPDALVTAYAYAVTLQPPRREKLGDGLVLQFVTRFNDPFEQTRALFEGWQKIGLKRMLFRPNDFCSDFGLPLGFGERIFNHQKIAWDYGALGMDHDCCYGFWTGISGLAYYAAARMHIDPHRDFAYWENHFAEAFGAAKQDVRAYHQYWRDKFDAAIFPADRKIRETRPGITEGEGFLRWNGQGILASSIGDCFSEEDFDETDVILSRGRSRDLTDVQERLLERLLLANRHNRMTFRTMRAMAEPDIVEALESADALVAFRARHRDDLRMNWPQLFRMHTAVCGVDTAALAATHAKLRRSGRPLPEVIDSAENLVSNSGFEDGLTGWRRSRWPRELEDVRNSDDSEVTASPRAPFEGGSCAQFEIIPRNREFVYSITQTIDSIEPGVSYLFRYAWKRETDDELTRRDTLRAPRFRLTFLDANGQPTEYGAAGKTRYWGDAGDQSLNTEWAQVSRLIHIRPDSGIRSASITFFASSYSRNMIDRVEWLALK